MDFVVILTEDTSRRIGIILPDWMASIELAFRIADAFGVKIGDVFDCEIKEG